jgi:tetratricopeptide (TPR) repeat protein
MPLLGMRRSADAWMGLLDLGREAAQQDGDEVAETFFHNALGIGAVFTGRYLVAEKHFLNTLRLQERRGNAIGIIGARLNLAALHGDMGRTALAVRELTPVVEHERRTSGLFLSRALNALCDNLSRQGRHEENLRYAREAHAVATGAADTPAIAYAQSNIAAGLAGLGQTGEATTAYEDALDLAGKCGDRRLQARTLLGFGDLLAATGRADPARARWTEALALLDGINSEEAESVRRRLAS